MKKILYFLIPTLLFLSCIEKYDVPLRSETPKLVIEGSINTGLPPYQIKLSYSGVFEYATLLPNDAVINSAKVLLSDNQGNSTNFRYLGKGIYQSTNLKFRGKAGLTYSLNIVLPNGRVFVSKPEKMPSIVPVQKAYGEYIVNYFTRQESAGYIGYYPAEPDGPTGYRIFIDTKDPAGEKNYYRWTGNSITRRFTKGTSCGFFTLCDQTCFVPTNYEQLNILSDQLFDGNQIIKKPLFLTSVFVTGRMYIEVNQWNYTREAYQFWQRYQEQTTATGSILDPLPAAIEGNVYNQDKPSELALGYFSAASLFKKRLTIDVTDPYQLPRGNVFPREGGCASEVYLKRGAYAVDNWPSPLDWATEDPNK